MDTCNSNSHMALVIFNLTCAATTGKLSSAYISIWPRLIPPQH